VPVNNLPVLHASRVFALPPDRDNHMTSPLVEPRGESNEVELRDCDKCAARARCRPEKFALDVCELQISHRKYAMTGEYSGKNRRRAADRAAIVEAIRARRTFSVDDIHQDTDLLNWTIIGHISHLLRAGTIRHVRRADKAVIYELVEEP